MQGDPENCHIFHLDKFVPGFIDFLAERFGLDNHSLFIWGPERYAFDLRRGYPINWIDSNKEIQTLLNNMKSSKRVFLHGLFVSALIDLLYKNQELLCKCFWIIWGGDLYNYRAALRTPQRRLLEAKRRVVLGNMKHFLGVPGDCELALDIYKSIADTSTFIAYPNNHELREYCPRQEEDGRLRIVVGNSATPENQHIEAFDMLESHREEIEVICPLTYGENNYREKIVSNGKKIFAGHFTALTEHMPPWEYQNFLKSVQVGFFNHNRQQAMGNILSLMGMGKKVYLRTGLTHSNFLSSLGLKFFDVTSFNTEPQDTEVSLRNHNLIATRFNLDYLRQSWNSLFR